MKHVKCKEATLCLGRSVNTRILVTTEAAEKYFVKPWHNLPVNTKNPSSSYNFHNSLRPAVVEKIAASLDFQGICPSAVITDIREVKNCSILKNTDSHAFYGLKKLEGNEFKYPEEKEKIQNVKNFEDIIQIVFMDVILSFNDRKEHNTNLFITDNNRLVMIDMDNYFTSKNENKDLSLFWKEDILENNFLTEFLLGNGNIFGKILDEIKTKFLQIPVDSLLNDIPEIWMKNGSGEDVLKIIKTAQKQVSLACHLISEMA